MPNFLLRDSIYKLYINTMYLFLRDANSLWGIRLIYKLYINKVYLLLRDAKLLLSDAINKLHINKVYLFLRDQMSNSFWEILFTS